MHEGKALRGYLKANNIGQDEFAVKLGYKNRGALPYYFAKDKLDTEFIEKMQAAGFDFLTKVRGGVPVYDLEATAGDLQFNGDMPEQVQGHITLPSFRECVAFLYVRGDSMYSILKAGDLIGLIPVVDKELIQYGNIYLIVTNDNQRMVKFIRKADNEDHIILRSKNKEYDDILLKTDKIRKLFRVKGPIRDDWQ